MTLPVRIALAALVAIAGCGPEFENITNVNLPLPAQYSNRTTGLADILGFENNIEHVAGAVFDEKDGGKTHQLVKTVLKQGAPAPEAVDLKNPALFVSVVDSTWKVDLSVLTNFAGALGANRKAELSITDLREVVIAPTDIPRQELEQLARQPLPAGVTRRFWVRAAVLTAVRTKIFTKLEGSGKISGVAFAAGGDVFHSAEALSEDRQIWMSVVDVKELAATAAPTTALPAALQRAIDAGAIKYHYDKDGRLADVSVKTLPQGLQLPPDWQSTMKAYAHETEQALTKATAVVRPPANRIRPLRVINGR